MYSSLIAVAQANILDPMTSSKPPGAFHTAVRNPGSAPRLEWFDALALDFESAEGRAREISARALGGNDRDVEALVQAVRLLDLTTLSDGDTDDSVRLLCSQALDPLDPNTLQGVDLGDRDVRVAAVCVYDRFVATARACLRGSGVRVAAVTAGFPVGLPGLSERLDQIRKTVEAGADEIDVVIDRDQVLASDWQALYDDVSAFRDACGPALLKTILAAGDLGSLRAVSQAGLVCCMAGADFIKTSTGRERVNATLPIGLAMAEAIRCYAQRAGSRVGLKPAGGIRTAEEALAWVQLTREEIGEAWVDPRYLRLGASSLLGEIRRYLGRPTRS
jgi:deoxyribose-phosphate aldolase